MELYMALIMVVDDSVIIRKQLMTSLTKHEHQVLEAASAAAAIDLARSPEPIQLIISDVNMPGMNGLDMLAEPCEDAHSDVDHRVHRTPSKRGDGEGCQRLDREALQRGATSRWYRSLLRRGESLNFNGFS